MFNILYHEMVELNSCRSINGLFAQSLRYVQKNNPRNIKHMPAVIFFTCLDLEQKSSFMDGHCLALITIVMLKYWNYGIIKISVFVIRHQVKVTLIFSQGKRI